MNDLLIVIILIFLGQTLGSIAGLLKKPTEKMLHISLAFAGSMMISVSLLELIPESLAFISIWEVCVYFILGIVTFKIIDHALPHVHPELLTKEQKSVRRTVQALVTGIAIHNLPEGLAIGVAFSLDPSMGIFIALTIAIQDIPENIATIVPLYCLNKCKSRSFLILMATILFEFVGFLLGYYIMGAASLEVVGASLAMAAGLMIYIALDELLPSADLKTYRKGGIAALVMGLVMVIGLGFLL